MSTARQKLDCSDDQLSLRRRLLIAWLQLLRLPNLLTVPGDPLVGFLLASCTGSVPLLHPVCAVLASLCFYAGGLLLNDVVDTFEDCLSHPERPLPSGVLSRGVVSLVATGLFLFGLLLCAMIQVQMLLVGFFLVLAILAYNLGLKKSIVFGPIMMGLCRGLSLLLGAASVGHMPCTVWAAAWLLVLYVASVTLLARYETRDRTPSFIRWCPAASLLIGIMAWPWIVHPVPVAMGVYAAVSLLAVYCVTLRVGLHITLHCRSVTPTQIGLLLSQLLFLQTALALFGHPTRAAMTSACCLMLAWIIHRRLALFFYES